MGRIKSCAIPAALLLAACGSQEQGSSGAEDAAAGNRMPVAEQAANEDTADSQLQPVDNAARPDQPNMNPDSENMEWSFSREGGTPRLAFGEPQADNVRLTLSCREDGAVLVSFTRPEEFAEGKPDLLSIVSGNARRSMTIETEHGQLGTSVQAAAPLSAAPLEQFRSGQELEVHWGDSTIHVPGAEDGPVRQFFEACASA